MPLAQQLQPQLVPHLHTAQHKARKSQGVSAQPALQPVTIWPWLSSVCHLTGPIHTKMGELCCTLDSQQAGRGRSCGNEVLRTRASYTSSTEPTEEQQEQSCCIPPGAAMLCAG